MIKLDDKCFTHFSLLTVSYVPSLLMNTINQASVFIKGENKYDLSLTINITIMMVLASIYLSVSNSLPVTAKIKPVELWLLFNLIYNFCLIITLVIMQVIVINCLNHHNKISFNRELTIMKKTLQKLKRPFLIRRSLSSRLTSLK